MQQILIPLGIIVLMAILGQLMNWLKRTAEQRMRERNRTAERDRPPTVAPIRTDTRDISRYRKAVDAQRQKALPSPRPVAKPPLVQTVMPAKKPRLSDTSPTAFPQAKSRSDSADQAKADQLPVAVVVQKSADGPVVTAPAQLVKPRRASAAPVNPKAGPTTPFGKQFTALLSGPNAAALAVALQEVLGPPKCKRG